MPLPRRTIGTLAGQRRLHPKMQSRAGLLMPVRRGDECVHVLDEPLKIAEILKPGGDDVVGHLNVLVHKHISKSDRLAQCIRKVGRKYFVTAEQSHRVTVVGRRPPPFRRADVLCDVDTGFDRCNEGVLDAAQPYGVRTARLGGRGFTPQNRQVIRDTAQQPQYTNLIDHGAPLRRTPDGLA